MRRCEIWATDLVDSVDAAMAATAMAAATVADQLLY